MRQTRIGRAVSDIEAPRVGRVVSDIEVVQNRKTNVRH